MYIFLAILFLYGAIGMEPRRVAFFGIVTAGLYFALTIPLLIQTAHSFGAHYALVQLAGGWTAILVLVMGSFFVGRLARIASTAIAAKRSSHRH